MMKRLLLPLVAASVMASGCVMVSGGSKDAHKNEVKKEQPADAKSGTVTPAAVAETPAATPAAAAATDDVKTNRTALVAKLDQIFTKDPRFANAHWGVMVKSLKTGETWYEHDSNKLFNPASNEKIPTSSTALTVLGPDFRYITTVDGNGEIKDGTLKGDLVVFGQGDPSMYAYKEPALKFQWWQDSRDVFRTWAKQLKEKGVTHITGNIVGDDNAWSDQHTGQGWPPPDDIAAWYYAEYGALQFNENYVDIKITPPAAPGGEVKLEPNVPSKYFTLVNKIGTDPNGSTSVNLNRDTGSNTITLTGNVKPGAAVLTETASITNPTLWFVTVLKETLQAEGITVDGEPKDCDDIAGWDHKPTDFPTLITHSSPPLSEIMTLLVKRSQNMYAETMVYTQGWKKTGKGSFESGQKSVAEELKKMGVESTDYEYADGSGLSRYDYISPAAIIKIETFMRNSPNWQTWYDMQSIAGVDGTLKRRMKGTKAEGNVHGKTGTISNVRALSGYVKTAAGEELVFSFLVNGHTRTSAETDSITDAAAVALADYEGN
ncbi:D-alanyl-D-alanine carboxypeptidase/D-alanyl-D-alanine-endopeptidase [soil metagenome]